MKVGLSILGAMVILIGAVWLVDSAQTFESYYETYQKLKETEQKSGDGSHASSQPHPMRSIPSIGSMENLYRYDFNMSREM